MKSDGWTSKLGVILAVAGSAVGLGNFLKFPGQVAMYGGAAFMIAYVVSFFMLGLPISICEWTMGRHGGANGFNSPPGILGFFARSKKMSYFGLLSVLMTMIIFCYYIYIEAWCLGYAVNFLFGTLDFSTTQQAGDFFNGFVGAGADGSAMKFGLGGVLAYFLFSFFLNFTLIYRGVSKGIELFCKYAMPTLVFLAILIVIRMATLTDISAEHPERTINQGMGFMWNPVKVVLEKNDGGKWVEAQRLVGDIEIAAAREKVEASKSAPSAQPALRIREISVWEQLANPSIWIAAAGQVFFSLTVGFGAIMTYASYLKRRDDIVLSSITSCAANEFCEVCLGGLITVPAAVAFLGVAGVMGAGLSLFDLGFKVLPMFFSHIAFGQVFGFMFFFLLFLAAVTSSLSMLQPSMAFIEESVKIRRKFSTLMLGILAFFISGFVVFFSGGLKAMDTFDFWMGQVAIYIFAVVQICLFSWYFGAERGTRLARIGSQIRLPNFYVPLVKYITPVFLIAVFILWLAKDVFGILGSGEISPYILDIVGSETHPRNAVAVMAVVIIGALGIFYAAILSISNRYDKLGGSKK